MSITIHKPLSPCQKCHFIKAQTNNTIVKAVQQESKIRSNDEYNQFDEDNNAIHNFLYALKAPETKRQYPRRLKVFLDFLQIDSPYSDFDQDLRYKSSIFAKSAKDSLFALLIFLIILYVYQDLI